MASTENGATTLSAPLPKGISSAVSGFDADDEGTTALTALKAACSALSSFDADDGTTALGTPLLGVPPRPVTYYKMRALDQNCAPSPPTYRTWIVIGSPDASASRYAGAYCGAGVSFTDIVVVDVWRA